MAKKNHKKSHSTNNADSSESPFVSFLKKHKIVLAVVGVIVVVLVVLGIVFRKNISNIFRGDGWMIKSINNNGGDDTTPPGDDTTPPGDDTTPPGDDTTPPGDTTPVINPSNSLPGSAPIGDINPGVKITVDADVPYHKNVGYDAGGSDFFGVSKSDTSKVHPGNYICIDGIQYKVKHIKKRSGNVDYVYIDRGLEESVVFGTEILIGPCAPAGASGELE